MNNTIKILLCVLTISLFLSGCGPRSAFPTEMIDGTITLDGAPLSEAIIAFSPVLDETPGAKAAYAHSDSLGKFKVTAANGGLEGRGTAVGKYHITVKKVVATTHLSDAQIKEMNDKGIAVQMVFKSAIPEKYNDQDQSGLTFEVVKGKNVLNIDLKSK